MHRQPTNLLVSIIAFSLMNTECVSFLVAGFGIIPFRCLTMRAECVLPVLGRGGSAIAEMFCHVESLLAVEGSGSHTLSAVVTLYVLIRCRTVLVSHFAQQSGVTGVAFAILAGHIGQNVKVERLILVVFQVPGKVGFPFSAGTTVAKEFAAIVVG